MKEKITHPLHQDVALRGSLWITVGGHNFGGHGRIELLERIDASGSISQAAKGMKMSYKAAWDTIDAMNNLADAPLVERQVGGKKGGGTRLTERGRQLISNFHLIEQEHRHFVDALSKQAANITQDLLLIRRMGMKTSARNQLSCKVAEIRKGAVNDEVILETASGQKITAIITRESSDDLQLKQGAEALALIKASSVILVTQDNDVKFSARNRISGKISRLTTGAVNSEVAIEADKGGTIAAIITNESCTKLALAEGKTATAIFKASSVMVGVPA